MNKRNELGKKTYGGQPEDIALTDALVDKVKKSGLSVTQFAIKCGVPDANVTLSYMLNHKRGLCFWKAVRMANAFGVDLGKIQKEFKC